MGEPLKLSPPSAEAARMKTKLFRAMMAVAMLAVVLQAFGAAIKW